MPALRWHVNCRLVTVDPGASLANLDKFIEARFAAEAAGSELTHWIVKPAAAEALSKLKTASGSNQTLIQLVADGIQIAGLAGAPRELDRR